MARPLIWRRWRGAKREPSWLPPSWVRQRYHRVVDQLYLQFYQRHADLTGMAWYASKLKSGDETVRTLAQSFVAADEYFAQL